MSSVAKRGHTAEADVDSTLNEPPAGAKKIKAAPALSKATAASQEARKKKKKGKEARRTCQKEARALEAELLAAHKLTIIHRTANPPLPMPLRSCAAKTASDVAVPAEAAEQARREDTEKTACDAAEPAAAAMQVYRYEAEKATRDAAVAAAAAQARRVEAESAEKATRDAAAAQARRDEAEKAARDAADAAAAKQARRDEAEKATRDAAEAAAAAQARRVEAEKAIRDAAAAAVQARRDEDEKAARDAAEAAAEQARRDEDEKATRDAAEQARCDETEKAARDAAKAARRDETVKSARDVANAAAEQARPVEKTARDASAATEQVRCGEAVMEACSRFGFGKFRAVRPVKQWVAPCYMFADKARLGNSAVFDIDIVHRALKEAAPVIVMTGFKVDFTAGDLLKLCPGKWLNDEVVNMYLQLISVPHFSGNVVYMPGSFFYSKLFEKGVYTYTNVQTWSQSWSTRVHGEAPPRRRPSAKTAFDYDEFVVPINKDNMHWALVVVTPKERRVRFYDSIRDASFGKLVCTHIVRYLSDEFNAWSGWGVPEDELTAFCNQWSIEVLADLPQQRDGVSCGVFVCMFAHYMLLNKAFDFSTSDMEAMRCHIAVSILTGVVTKTPRKLRWPTGL